VQQLEQLDEQLELSVLWSVVREQRSEHEHDGVQQLHAGAVQRRHAVRGHRLQRFLDVLLRVPTERRRLLWRLLR
jgi:hypothetical protein